MGFHLQNGIEYVEDVPLSHLALAYGTPLHVYSENLLNTQIQKFKSALGDHPHHIHFAVKSNSNLHLLKHCQKQGLGFDIVSGGELARLKAIDALSAPIIFSGVGKTQAELMDAIQSEVFAIHIESEAEFYNVAKLSAALKKKISIGFRINPNVEASTHRHISTGTADHKFGIPFELARHLATQIPAFPFLNLRGISCHIGSQIQDVLPFQLAARRLRGMGESFEAQNLTLEYLDVGGGFGIQYDKHQPPPPLTEQVQAICAELPQNKTLILEPGRALIGPAGLLLTQVILTKKNGNTHFAVVDASMTELIRPALYDAYHEIRTVQPTQPHVSPQTWHVVGPVCETGDYLGHARSLSLEAGSLLAVLDTGAYGASMSSHYNSRSQAAEVWVKGDQVIRIRKRETLDDLFALESAAP